MSSEPKNILIVRLSAIGDIVMASGLIPSLKKCYPNAKISWLAEPIGASLLNQNSDLTEVVLWPRQEWTQLHKQKKYWSLFKAVRAFRKKLKAKQYDLVLDTQGLLKSALLTRMTSAPRRIGLGSKEGGQYLMHEVVPRELKDMISSEYRDMAIYLGSESSDFEMQLPPGEVNRIKAQDLIKEKVGEQTYIVLCPFTTRPQKHWIESYWPKLAEQLEITFGLPCLVLGGPDNNEDANRIFNSANNCHVLAGSTNLLQTSEVIANATLLIGVDTGITHMGIAHKVPSVAIFGSTRPYLVTPNDNAQIIYDGLACAPCKRRPSCDGRFDCMQQITPERIIEIAQELLSESTAH